MSTDEIELPLPEGVPNQTASEQTTADAQDEQVIELDPNYVITQPEWTTTGAKIDAEREMIALPSATQEVTNEKLGTFNNGNLAGADVEWATTVGAGSIASFAKDGGNGAAIREGSNWAQEVKAESGNLRAVYPLFRPKENQSYTAEAASFLIRSALKLGAVFQLPLWHTGIWITLRTPTDGELLELYRQLVQDKIDIGRKTYGLMFSNMQAFTHDRLFDFILDHVYDTSLAIKDVSELRAVIKLPDLNLLIWGLACATWPGGFQYSRSCLADPDKCHHIVKEKINLSKLQWTDITQLTARQIKHMTNRSKQTMTKEAVDLYQQDFVIGQDRLFKMTDDLSMTFKIPSINDHIESGNRWISMIEETYGRAMTMDEAARNEYLNNQAKATMMRQYTHCVKSINLGEREFPEVETLERALNDLTARDDLHQQFTDGVRKFLDDSIVSFVAIPPYKCPACGKDQPVAQDSKYSSVLALDAAQSFFQLLVQKQIRIQNRDFVSM